MKLSLALVICLAAGGLISTADTYGADPLPKALNGRWFGTGQGGARRNFEVSVVIEKQESDGTIQGQLTRWGNGCGAQNEPLRGSYDGTVLKFTTMSRANINASKANGTCGEDEYILKRAADGSFEGTFGDVGSPQFSIVLKP